MKVLTNAKDSYSFSQFVMIKLILYAWQANTVYVHGMIMRMISVVYWTMTWVSVYKYIWWFVYTRSIIIITHCWHLYHISTAFRLNQGMPRYITSVSVTDSSVVTLQSKPQIELFDSFNKEGRSWLYCTEWKADLSFLWSFSYETGFPLM